MSENFNFDKYYSISLGLGLINDGGHMMLLGYMERGLYHENMV